MLLYSIYHFTNYSRIFNVNNRRTLKMCFYNSTIRSQPFKMLLWQLFLTLYNGLYSVFAADKASLLHIILNFYIVIFFFCDFFLFLQAIYMDHILRGRMYPIALHNNEISIIFQENFNEIS